MDEKNVKVAPENRLKSDESLHKVFMTSKIKKCKN